MRAVLQRVDQARVEVAGEILGAIERGFVALVAVGEGDTPKDATYLAHKIIHLRVFEDEQGKMNRSLLEEGGALLVISQFTLYGDCRKGRRPSFVKAMPPQEAAPLIEHLIREVQEQGVEVQSGQFGAQMKVYLCNNGPVTLLLESRT